LIEFTVSASTHGPVALSAEDFEVTEDGVRQSLEAFQEAVAPISIVLAVDASGSMKPAADAVKTAAKSFVGALRKEDQLALLVFSDQAVMVHDLTTKREWTLEGLDQYKATGGTALNDALFNALTRLSAIDGRRAIVVLTDGRDENGPGTAPGSRHTMAQVLEQIHDVDATVYAIGLGRHVDHEALESLASRSGGEAFFPDDVDALPDQYRRVIECLRQRYVASYLSTNRTRDGKWRKVDIASVRPELEVKTRGGYFAPER
jgi:Ca-activated chloride channel homolog